MRNAARLLLLAAVAMLAVWGCSEDENEPVTGTLSGRVIFHGQWPDSGAVQLSIFQNWSTSPCAWCAEAPGGPPSYYTHSSYFHDPDTLNGDGPDTMSYTITGITPGTYSAVAVGWRAPTVSNIHCDEPVIGLGGADPYTTDSIPEPVTFTESLPTITRDVHAFFSLQAVPGCNDRGRIEGVARVNGGWPAEGLLVMITTFPVSGWNPVMGQPTGYYIMPTPADSVFYFVEPYSTYYLSIWSNVAPPAQPYWYGSYGVHSGDARPDALVLSANTPLHSGLVVEGLAPAPHWISGTITFNGTRPAEGLLVLFSTFMYSPEHPPTGAPSGYCPVTDPNETLYAMTGLPVGTYYVSLWNYVAPPTVPTFYGAYGYTAGSDTDPDPVTLGATQTDWGRNGINITAHPVYDSLGTISGVVRVNEPWPSEGLLVLITNFPFTPWHVPTGSPAYFPLLTPQDTVFQFTPRYGTYYLSIWNNVAPPAVPLWYGSYGVRTAQRDARPDGIFINALHPVAPGIVVEGQSPPPHYISGNVTFNGTRPTEGLLVLFSTFMFTPEHPPTGAPSGYYSIIDPNETLYAMTGLPEGTYYVSLWNNVPPPATPTFYGAHGYTAGSDTDPDPVTLGATAATWGAINKNIVGNP